MVVFSLFNIQYSAHMMIIIILFYFSLAIIILMVLWKLVSIRELKFSLIEGVGKEFHRKFYEKVHELWYVFFVPHLVRTRVFVLAIFFIVAHEVLHIVGVWGQKLKVRHSKLFDMVKGKGVIKSKGSASFFLRDVAEYKESIKSKSL